MAGITSGSRPRAAGILTGWWRCRWNLVRIAVAALLLLALVLDVPAALAWMQYRALPSLNYLERAEELERQDRLEEAIAVVEAGLEDPQYARVHQEELHRKLKELRDEQRSWIKKVKRFVGGAVSGYGDRPEALAGAIVADFFIVGDVRDIVIEGYKYISNDDANKLVFALSVVGVVTTVAPYFDLGPAIMKLAAKTGAMSRKLFDKVMDLARLAIRGERKPLMVLAGDVATVARHGGGAAAIHVLKHVDDPAEVAKLARYTEREGKRAAFVLHVLEGDGVRTIARSGDDLAEQAVLLAARKGDAGRAWLRSGKWRLALRPHPVLGLVKGFAKGNVQKAAMQLTQNLLRPYFWIALPAVLAWFGLELIWLSRKRAALAAS